MALRSIKRREFGAVEVGQPPIWTLIDFSFADDVLTQLAAALEAALDEAFGWYCDLHTPEETAVVFAGRSFRYLRGSEAGRAEATEYARSRGVPEHQLDWPA